LVAAGAGNADRASYAPLIFFAVVVVVLLLTFIVVRKDLPWPRAPRRSVGLRLSGTDARMQDTAEGFGQPIRQIFEIFMRVERERPDPFSRTPHYRGDSRDKIWLLLYQPIAAHCGLDFGSGGPPAAWPHPVVSDLQLRHADLPACFCDTVRGKGQT
jgi:hypothetical protein